MKKGKKQTPPPQPPTPEKYDVQAFAKLARIREFRNLLAKIQAGEASAADMKTLSVLEREIAADDDNTTATTPEILTPKEVLGYIDISRRMLSYHTTKGNLKVNADGTYDKAELDRWAEKYRRKSKRKTPGDTLTVGEQRELADLRYKIARAEREELVTAQLKANLYNRDEVEAALAELILTTKKAFLLLPHAAPTLLAGKDPVGQMETLQGMADEIITGLSEQATLKQIERRIK